MLPEATWSQEAYLKASNTDFDDQFGVSVALSGSRVAVGAFHEQSAAGGVNPGPGPESNNSADNSGAVYAYR